MIRAKVTCALLTAVACMLFVSPAQSFAASSTEDLVKIREEGVREIRKIAAHTRDEINHKAAEAVQKIAKEDKKDKKDSDKKVLKESEKAVEEISKKTDKGIAEIVKERDETIKRLVERGAPQRFKARVFRVAHRRMTAVRNFGNAAVARVYNAAWNATH